MKTDDFDDSIRRKLESIDPPYREKDWLRLQDHLHQHVPTGSWFSRTGWLMPSAAAAAITGLLVATTYLYNDNRQLRQTVQRLNDTIVQLRKQQAIVPAPSAPDTVYLKEYVQRAAPQRVTDNDLGTSSVAKVNEVADRSTAESIESAPEGKRTKTELSDTIQSGTIENTSSVAVQKNNSLHDTTSTYITINSDNSVRATPESRSSTLTSRTNNRITRKGSRARSSTVLNNNKVTGQTGIARTDRDRSGRTSDRTESVAGTTPTSKQPESGNVSTITPKVIEITPLASTPMRFDSGYFKERMERRSRRIWRLPLSVSPAQVAVKEPVPSPEFRIGMGAELGVGQRSAGLFSELLIGRHLSVGVGLAQRSISGGTFLTDFQFRNRTRHDFRKDYARGIDPRHEIIDISRRSITWQIPIQVGYRLPVGEGVSLIPAVGTNLSLTSKERVGFTYRRGPNEFNPAYYFIKRPNSWYNSWNVAIGLEKQWGHWVLQGSPYVMAPFEKVPFDLHTISVGMRVRALYQF